LTIIISRRNQQRKIEMAIKQAPKLVTPTGRIVFLKNLFEPNNKGKYTCSLLLDKDSSDAMKKLESLMVEAAKAEFDDKTLASKKFKWGMKTPDEEAIEKYAFMDANKYVLNTSTKFQIPVVGNRKGSDGKFLPLIEGDLKAGDYCRFFVSAFAWENKIEGVNRGVSFNLLGVQLVKEGEPLYERKDSVDVFSSVAFDMEVPKSEDKDLDGLDAFEF